MNTISVPASKMPVRQKFAIVTGCGQGGIGEALALEYARLGIFPIATVLPSEGSEHLTTSGITWFPLDVTKDDSISAFKKQVTAVTGGFLDILVNNAGIAYTMTATDTDVRAVQEMFDVNVFGPMRMVHYFHDMIFTSKGIVVNIGSVGGIVPYVYGSSYNASKAALHHWSNTLRVEMAPLGVRVLTIISGEIGTNILKRDRHRELPEYSLFAPLRESFKSHVTRTPNTTDRMEYAKNVCVQSLNNNPPIWYWFGKTTWTVRFLDTVGWRGVWDYVFWHMFDLGKLRDVFL
ncbi:NAD(P)-binding protein [Xylaria cubensis]|nr:NAD(P)-binding protein [Xylaria cubensis]